MVADLVEEMTTLRPATGLFFKSMDEEDLGETGRSWKSGMSVLAMGFTILRHQRSPFWILRERYLPML